MDIACRRVLHKCVSGAYNRAMRQYERYLFMHLLLPTVLVTAALTGIIWLTQMMRFIQYILNRGLTIGDFLYLTGLMLPNLLLVLLPISLGIAVIYTYNRLTADSELVVLNAVGVSKLQLARPVLVLGGAAMVLCYILALYVMPLSNQKFSDLRNFFRDKYASVLLEEEVFNTPVNGITVFVRERDKKGILHGILLHDNRDVYAPMTMMAERGRLEQTDNGPRFYLEKGVRQQVENGRISWLSFDDYALDVAFYAETTERAREPKEMYLPQLLKGDPTDEKNNRSMHAEAQQRLAWPLLSLILPLLALATLSTGEFNRRGQWKRIIHAAISIAGAVILFFLLRSMITKNTALTPLLYAYCVGAIALSFQMLLTGRYLWTRRPHTSPQPMAGTT